MHMIEKNPNKDNIRYAVRYVDNDWSFHDIFHNLISEMKKEGVETEGTLIFCKTRKQCSLVYRTFAVSLGKYLYLGGKEAPRNSIVEMFHAGTPDLATMTSKNGHEL